MELSKARSCPERQCLDQRKLPSLPSTASTRLGEPCCAANWRGYPLRHCNACRVARVVGGGKRTDGIRRGAAEGEERERGAARRTREAVRLYGRRVGKTNDVAHPRRVARRKVRGSETLHRCIGRSGVASWAYVSRAYRTLPTLVSSIRTDTSTSAPRQTRCA